MTRQLYTLGESPCTHSTDEGWSLCSGIQKIYSPAGNRTPAFQPVAHRYALQTYPDSKEQQGRYCNFYYLLCKYGCSIWSLSVKEMQHVCTESAINSLQTSRTDTWTCSNSELTSEAMNLITIFDRNFWTRDRLSSRPTARGRIRIFIQVSTRIRNRCPRPRPRSRDLCETYTFTNAIILIQPSIW
jgi:hypothetical protein